MIPRMGLVFGKFYGGCGDQIMVQCIVGVTISLCNDHCYRDNIDHVIYCYHCNLCNRHVINAAAPVEFAFPAINVYVEGPDTPGKRA